MGKLVSLLTPARWTTLRRQYWRFGDPELAARMGAAGRQWALENFTEEAFARTLERLLRFSGHRTES